MSSGHQNEEEFRSFDVSGLASTPFTSATGMKNEIVILSWLLVLLRTGEGSQIQYDWAFKGLESSSERAIIANSLLMGAIITDTEGNVGQSLEATISHISKVDPSQCRTTSKPLSILLSTQSLSQISEDAKDEVSRSLILAVSEFS